MGALSMKDMTRLKSLTNTTSLRNLQDDTVNKMRNMQSTNRSVSDARPSRSRSGFAASKTLAALSVMSLLALLPTASAEAQTFGEQNPYAALRVAPTDAGAAASHDLLVNLGEGEFEPLTIQIGYPLDFVFNGFEDTAGSNSVVGSLSLTNLPDQIRFDKTYQIRARCHDTAYADISQDGKYTRGIDVLITHSAFSNYQALIMYFPFGGDADAETLTTLRDVRVGAHINTGVFTNPAGATDYALRTTLISVDPDTDNLNDGAGDEPIQVQTVLSTPIGASTLCAAAPSAECRRGGKSKLIVKNSDKPGKDLLKWIFAKGDAATYAELGTPNATTAYALCIYDSSSALGLAPTALQIPANGVKWSAKAPKLVLYKDKAGSPDGVIGIKLSAGAQGKSKAKVIAKGANLVLPAPAGSTFFNLGPNVQVQLFNDAGECWTSEFVAAKTNESAKFIAKASN
jgi:hypothetical protein